MFMALTSFNVGVALLRWPANVMFARGQHQILSCCQPQGQRLKGCGLWMSMKGCSFLKPLLVLSSLIHYDCRRSAARGGAGASCCSRCATSRPPGDSPWSSSRRGTSPSWTSPDSRVRPPSPASVTHIHLSRLTL